jgi:hypothetical protein
MRGERIGQRMDRTLQPVYSIGWGDPPYPFVRWNIRSPFIRPSTLHRGTPLVRRESAPETGAGSEQKPGFSEKTRFLVLYSGKARLGRPSKSGSSGGWRSISSRTSCMARSNWVSTPRA